MTEDRELLLAALRPAVAAYLAETKGSTILGRPEPSPATLEFVAEAIERCAAFQAVKGKSLFNGRLGLKIAADVLSSHVVSRAAGPFGDSTSGLVEESASWILRLLKTAKTKAQFSAAIWGLTVDEQIMLPGGSRLLPFDYLPDSRVKERIVSRASSRGMRLPWINQRSHGVPRAAYIHEIPDLPYIFDNISLIFGFFDTFLSHAQVIWSVIQAISIGSSLDICYWIGIEDKSLYLDEWKTWENWILPEVNPTIYTAHNADPAAIITDLRNYLALPEEMRHDLMRSMTRYTLGRCRNEITDQVLDLALAFEIAVSGGEQNLAVNWKVSVRSAQLIGGSLAERLECRKTLSDFYGLRSKATHGSSLSKLPEAKLAPIDACYGLYTKLMRRLLSLSDDLLLNDGPNWGAIELGPDHGAN